MKESNQTLKNLLASMTTQHKSFREAKAVAEVASKKSLKEYGQLKAENVTLRTANADLFAQLQRGQRDIEMKDSIQTLREANEKLGANKQSLEKNCKSLDDQLKAKEAEIQMMKDTAVSRDTFDDYRTHSLTLVRDLEKSLKLKEEKIQMMKKVAIDRDGEADAKRTHILNLARMTRTDVNNSLFFNY